MADSINARRDPSLRSRHLPAWVWDVDDVDVIDMQNRTLLQELEIDLAHVLSFVHWTMMAPLYRLVCQRIPDKHPLAVKMSLGNNNSSSSNSGSSSASDVPVVDFWGPCFFVSLYIALLWLAKVKSVVWVYLIWCLAALFNHLVTRVWSGSSALAIHLSILGYSIIPAVLFSSCLLLLRPLPWISSLIQLTAASWATFATLLAYVSVFPLPNDQRHRLALLIPPVLLMQLYFLSILPIN